MNLKVFTYAACWFMIFPTGYVIHKQLFSKPSNEADVFLGVPARTSPITSYSYDVAKADQKKEGNMMNWPVPPKLPEEIVVVTKPKSPTAPIAIVESVVKPVSKVELPEEKVFVMTEEQVLTLLQAAAKQNQEAVKVELMALRSNIEENTSRYSNEIKEIKTLIQNDRSSNKTSLVLKNGVWQTADVE